MEMEIEVEEDSDDVMSRAVRMNGLTDLLTIDSL